MNVRWLTSRLMINVASGNHELASTTAVSEITALSGHDADIPKSTQMTLFGHRTAIY